MYLHVYVYTGYTKTVMNNIPDLTQSRKTSNYAIIVTIILLGILSFGLGRLSALSDKNEPRISICKNKNIEIKSDTTAITINSQEKQKAKQYVASKKGHVYHLPWCSGAKRIKETNKIWFETKKEAEKAGYKPAGNCKGI